MPPYYALPRPQKVPYILPKPTRPSDNRKILLDIKNVLPPIYQPGIVHWTATSQQTGQVSAQNPASVSSGMRMDSGPHKVDNEGINRQKLLKEEDRGFLLFIVTHGKQLATRMPHLSETDALKTFKMLWSKMTPEHKSWYYNNENVIQDASRHQHCPGNALCEFKAGRTESMTQRDTHSAYATECLQKRSRRHKYVPEQYKAYQIRRPIRQLTSLMGNVQQTSPLLPDWSILEDDAFNLEESKIIYQDDTLNGKGDTGYIRECQTAIESIEMDEQKTYPPPNAKLTNNVTEETENTIVFTNCEGANVKNIAIEMESEEMNGVYTTGQILSPQDELIETRESQILSYAVSAETKPADAGYDLSSGVVTNEGTIVKIEPNDTAGQESVDGVEYVMIPCDVKIAAMLGWPVHLLPRVSKADLDRYKRHVNI